MSTEYYSIAYEDSERHRSVLSFSPAQFDPSPGWFPGNAGLEWARGLKLHVGPADLIAPDFLPNPLSLFFASSRLTPMVLAADGQAAHREIPTTSGSPPRSAAPYQLVHVERFFDCLDVGRSSVLRGPDESIGAVVSPVLRAAVIPQRIPVFRVIGCTGQLFASEAFRQRFTAAGLTGARFVPVDLV